jgi:hypothetical protein
VCQASETVVKQKTPTCKGWRFDGLLFLGPEVNGEHYRPDEIELLRTSPHQLGVELESLRIEELERNASQLRQRLLVSEERSLVLEQQSAVHERETVALRHWSTSGCARCNRHRPFDRRWTGAED